MARSARSRRIRGTSFHLALHHWQFLPETPRSPPANSVGNANDLRAMVRVRTARLPCASHRTSQLQGRSFRWISASAISASPSTAAISKATARCCSAASRRWCDCRWNSAADRRRAAHRRTRFRLSRLAAGRLDQELWSQQNCSPPHDIRFQPGLNEDLAATCCGAATDRRLPRASGSMACSASGTARARASIAAATRCAAPTCSAPRRWRRARGGRRRSRRAFVHLSAPDRPGLRGADDAGAAARRRWRDPRLGLAGFALSRFSGCGWR